MALQGYDVLKLDTTGMTYPDLNQIAGDLALSKGILRFRKLQKLRNRKEKRFFNMSRKTSS